MTNQLTAVQRLAYNRGPGHFVDPDLLTLPLPVTPPPRVSTTPPPIYRVLIPAMAVAQLVAAVAIVACIIDGEIGAAAVLLAFCALGVFTLPSRRNSPWAKERAALARRADLETFGHTTTNDAAEKPDHHRDQQEYLAKLNRELVDGVETQRPLLDGRVLKPNAQTAADRRNNIDIIQARIKEGRDTFTGELLPSYSFARVRLQPDPRIIRHFTA